MKKRYIINYKRLCLYLFLFNITSGIHIAGSAMNVLAIKSNDFRMPVYSELNYSTDSHFSFTEKEEINNYLLTDIIPFGNWMWSVGDFLVAGASALYLSILIVAFFTKYTVFREEK